MNQTKLVIGLFGFGVVGEGLYKVLSQTPSLKAVIKKICIKHPEKPRSAPAGLFTTERDALLDDPEINVIVEVTDDSKAAFEIVKRALLSGKAAVSAGKKMIAEHLPELLELQETTGQPFLYESAACASIPVIRNLEEYYDNELLYALQGIVNGSTNYILSKIFEEGLSFDTALKSAQELGFAESNPALDVRGEDAAHKWVILLHHAYGIRTTTEELLFNGIESIGAEDARYARQRNWSLKLLAHAGKLSNEEVAAFVLPAFVSKDSPLSFVNRENNAVIVESAFADRQFFYGKGAGSLPTGSALLSDISALRYQYRYEHKKSKGVVPPLAKGYYLRVYLRFTDPEVAGQLPLDTVEEAFDDRSGGYRIGLIHYSKLCGQQWWKAEGLSLILLPDPVVEQIDRRRPSVRLASAERDLAGTLV